MESQIGSLLNQSADILAKQLGQIDALKATTSKLAKIVEDNADTLPAGVAEKHDGLKSLVPEVSSLVQSLKDYQGTDLVDIDGDYSKVIGLYQEAMALVSGLSPPRKSSYPESSVSG